MQCQKCGNLNAQGTKFCIRCGNQLVQPTVQTMANPNQSINIQGQSNNLYGQQVQKPISNIQGYDAKPTQQDTPTKEIKTSILNYFLTIFSVVLKPVSALKEEKEKFSNFKNSAFLTVIIVSIATLLNLIKTMFNVVRVKSFDYKTGEIITKWVWENLKEIEYIKLIGQNILLYAGIALAISGLYYIAGLIAKKQINFSKLLGISSISLVPVLSASLILSPILSLISANIGLVIILIGTIYSMLIMYEGINEELNLEGNVKCYLNLACLSIFLVIGGFLAKELVIGSLISGIGSIGFGDISDLFG